METILTTYTTRNGRRTDVSHDPSHQYRNGHLDMYFVTVTLKDSNVGSSGVFPSTSTEVLDELRASQFCPQTFVDETAVILAEKDQDAEANR